MTKETNIAVQSQEQQQLALVKEKFDPSKYNQIFYTSTVMDVLPAGVQLIPSVVNMPPSEVWDKSELSFLKTGKVMLSATAIKKIGSVAGVKLERVTEEIRELNGQGWLLIEYRASMILPDGSVKSEVSGKQEKFTGDHTREKVDKKAKRNAIRELLDIPLTIPKEHVDKPFIIFKPVFRRGHSPETDAILDRIEGSKAAAMDLLYPGSSNQSLKAIPAATTTKEDGELSLSELTEMIRTAPDMQQLEALVVESMEVPKTEMQRKVWLEVVNARKAELSKGAANNV